MSAASPCVPCCSTPQSVNIPGLEGDAGDNGVDGVSAFSITTADAVVPAPAALVTVSANITTWMVIGQIVIVGQGVGAGLAGPGPSTFRINSIPSATTVSLKYLGYAGDVAPGGGNTLSAGCVISPAGDALASPLPVASGGTGAAAVAPALTNFGLGYTPTFVRSAGTSYTVTNAPAAIIMGTTSPDIVLAVSGTYLIYGAVRFDYVGATFAANRTLTAYLYKITGGPSQLTSESMFTQVLAAPTTMSFWVPLQPYIQVVTAADEYALYAGIDTVPGAGDAKVGQAYIVAQKLF